MNVLIVCVNYHSIPELIAFMGSVDKAMQEVNANLTFVIVDNSKEDEGVCSEINKQQFSFDYDFYRNVNNGYFGGIRKGLIEQGDIIKFDYVIGSNVDLTLDKSFFTQLSIQHSELVDATVIAPKIISNTSGIDMNPQVLIRHSKMKYIINWLIFSVPLIYAIQRKLSKYLRLNKERVSYPFAQEMYSAHGAFMIFTKEFFQLGGEINYPGFLYGEEIYIAEQVLKQGKKIRYNPELIIYDDAGVSTGKLNYRFLAQQHKKATEFFLKNYY